MKLVSLMKVFRLFRLERMFFGCFFKEFLLCSQSVRSSIEKCKKNGS